MDVELAYWKHLFTGLNYEYTYHLDYWPRWMIASQTSSTKEVGLALLDERIESVLQFVFSSDYVNCKSDCIWSVRK